MKFSLPLMENNISIEDRNAVIEFLKGDPILTQSSNVRAFEKEWSEWLGVRRSVFVNSGASANFIIMAALRHLYGPGEVVVPTLTWVSDISSVLAAGHTPVFVDVNPRTLAMDPKQVVAALNKNTRAVFLTHCQGFDGLDDAMLAELKKRNIPLIEDVCESHGATHHGRKAGSFGLASNFSFYFAHHMSTIEGGMVCTERRRRSTRPPACSAATAWSANPTTPNSARSGKRPPPTSTPSSFSPGPPATTAAPRSTPSSAAPS